MVLFPAEESAMSKVIVAAFSFAALTSFQASACDLNHEANATPVVVADGGGCNGCATEPTTDPTGPQPITQGPQEQTAAPAPPPVQIADGGCNGC